MDKENRFPAASFHKYRAQACPELADSDHYILYVEVEGDYATIKGKAVKPETKKKEE